MHVDVTEYKQVFIESEILSWEATSTGSVKKYEKVILLRKAFWLLQARQSGVSPITVSSEFYHQACSIKTMLWAFSSENHCDLIVSQ